MKFGSKYPWVVVGLLWFVALLNYLDRQMISTMRPAMKIDLAELESASNFGALMAVFLWVYGLMSPVAGLIADRVNRKLLIVASLTIWSAVTLAMGYATDFQTLYILRAVMGFSEAAYIPAALALIADYHSDQTRSLAIGIHMTGIYLGQALGGFGATIAERFSWQRTFFLFGWVGLFYALILIIFLKEYRGSEKNASEHKSANIPLITSFSTLFKNPAFWVILVVFAVPSLPGWAIKNWLPTLFSENLNLDMATAGPLATITIAASSFIGVIAGGVISDRWLQRHLKGRIFTSAIGLGLTIPALFLIGYGDSVLSVVGAAALFGLGFGLFDANNMPILCQFVSPRYRATAYGFMNLVGVFFGAYVTSLLGKISDQGHLGQGFIGLGLIVIVAVLSQLFLLKPHTRNLHEG